MKKLTTLLAVLLIFCSISVLPVSASEESSSEAQTYAETRTDEVVWYTRVYNGVRQKRLWSVTYNCWLTDWIDC